MSRLRVLLVFTIAACGDDDGSSADAPGSSDARVDGSSGPDSPGADAPSPDGPSADAAAPDAVADAAAPDAVADAAVADAAVADAAVADAAVADASTPDASTPDAALTCFTFTFALSGAEEVPAVTTAATGSGVVTIDTATNELTFNVTFADLSSAESAAHIHGFAPIGMEAGILFTLPAGSPKTGTVTYSDGQEANLLAGLAYVNIHSGNFPDGELRGQIDGPTPGCP